MLWRPCDRGPTHVTLRTTGTIVYEGVLDGRPVAVKRLLRQFYDLARKEIQVRAHAECPCVLLLQRWGCGGKG